MDTFLLHKNIQELERRITIKLEFHLEIHFLIVNLIDLLLKGGY